MPPRDERELAREKKLAKIREEEEEDLAKRKAKKLGLAYVNLRLRFMPQKALEAIPEEKARKAGAVVFEYVGKAFSLAAAEPESPAAKSIIAELSRFGEVTVYVASRSTLLHAFKGYAALPKPLEKITGEIVIHPQTEALFAKDTKSLDLAAKELAGLEEEDITKVAERMFAAAIAIESSDIHLEPVSEKAAVRFRIDGILHPMTSVSHALSEGIRDRIKLLSGMKLNVHNKAQDGRFTIKTAAKSIEVRASVTPGAYGENIVLRLLDPDKIALSLEDLGMRKKDLKVFLENLGKPNGMILTTGPTGSGKTTTLYAFLKRKRSPDIKIITIEDPIEYHLAGISQTQANPDRGYDFATGLRAALRQDPDVMLVGEIRDPETAKTALNASLTGHLVFSTLHTNEAVGAIARFEELGVERKNLPSAINLIIAQRLVRKLCPKCKEKYEPDEKTKKALLKALAIISPKAGIEVPQKVETLWRAVGCPDCWNLGYKGQLGLFEYFEMTKHITETVQKTASVPDLREIAMDEGMITLLQDGYLKALEGVTGLEEVSRVAGETAGYVEMLYEKVMAQKLRRGVRLTEEHLRSIRSAVGTKEGLADLLVETERKEQQKILAVTMGLGVLSRATDVHIEAKEREAVIRFRIDGILYDVHKLVLELYPTVIAEIKLLAGLKTEVHDKIQEGRFSMMMPGETRDVRVSIIPGGYGETAVLRILMPESRGLTFRDLGILPEFLPLIEKELEKPTGIILVSGPTGSGKTTTLYALTQRLNSPAVKIITIEDPIEYRLEGVLQTQIDVEQGYTFAAALRSILRQNPNIILLGEIRDTETATLAFQASLTGHLVLSTVHANDAVSVVARLKNLGLSLPEVSAALRAIISQRLVRRVCKNCVKTRGVTKEEEKLIAETLDALAPQWASVFSKITKKPYKTPLAVGCKECNFTGYHGQLGVYEILVPDERFANVIAKTESPIELEETARKAGMMTLRQDGLVKVLRGLTTLEEIERVL